MSFASKPLHYVDSGSTRNQMLLFPGFLEQWIVFFKKMITLENGENLQNTLSIAHTSRAFPFFVYLFLH